MKKPLLLLFAFMITAPLCADTLANYMSIEKKIPTMQLKADMSAHAWARSARKILVLHDEALSESMHEMNTLAKKNGHPLFCLPSETAISPENIHKILLKEASRIPEDKQKNVSVAKVAISAVLNRYACLGKEETFNTADDSDADADERSSAQISFDDAKARMSSVRSDDPSQ